MSLTSAVVEAGDNVSLGVSSRPEEKRRTFHPQKKLLAQTGEGALVSFS